MAAANALGSVNTARRRAETVARSDTTSTRSPRWVTAVTGEERTTASPSSAAMAFVTRPTPPSNCESWYPPAMFISGSTPPAERTRNSQHKSDTSDVSQAKQARTVASRRSRPSRVGTREGVIQARTDRASHAAARGASHGASTGTLWAMELNCRMP